MLITVSNQLIVENPTEELMNWCKKELTISNPEFIKKARMNLWLGNTPKYLTLYELNGDNLILPFGVLKTIPRELIEGAILISDFKAPSEVNFNASVPLYDYQEIAVEQMIKAKFGILQSKAGSGKTQMGIAIACKLNRKTLWLCHTLDLVKQSKERAEQYINKSLIGEISHGKVNIGKAITFATIQTMSKLDLPRYKDEWDVIITDEVHRVSGSPTSVTQYEKVLNNLSARHKYGLSATVHRADGLIKATFSLVGEVAYQVPDEAVADKIEKVGICPIYTGITVGTEALSPDGTINYTRLINYLSGNQERDKIIIDILKKNKDKSCLILSDRLIHLEQMINLLPMGMRKDSVMISGKMTSKTDKKLRNLAISQMRSGEKKYLFATYNLCKEGLDIPRLERLFLTTPQSDYAVVTQSIGRIARKFEDKAKPIAYDFVDSMNYLVRKYKARCTTYKKNDCYFVEKDI